MNPTIVTNATDTTLASALAEGGRTRAFLVLHKKGTTKGVAGAKKVYGDDVSQVLLWYGFPYRDLVERSLECLDKLWAGGNLTKRLMEAVEKTNNTTTVEEIFEVVQEVKESFLKTLGGSGDLFDDNPTGNSVPTWEPLTVNGQKVAGARVYIGKGNPSEDPQAAVPGTIYIDGVKLGEKIVVPAPNGYWNANRKPKTIIKDTLKSWLPIGMFAMYPLDRGRLIDLKIGDEALTARKLGISSQSFP